MKVSELSGRSDTQELRAALNSRGSATVFMNGMALLGLLLIVYVVIQIVGMTCVDNTGFANESVLLFSIWLNISVSVCLLGSYAWLHWTTRKGRKDGHGYWVVVFASSVVVAAALIQVHIVGSLNSLHHLMIVAILLVIFWFLRWREVLVFFIVSNVALGMITLLEILGVLPYAPLFAEGEMLRRIFLDWRTVFGQFINYSLVLVVCTIIVWKLRQILETSEQLREESNQALREEVKKHERTLKEKEELIEKLQASLDQVHKLHGLLPICANCKSIRDDKGYWQQLESYFLEHSPEIIFSHGLCPTCAEKLYPKDFKNEE